MTDLPPPFKDKIFIYLPRSLDFLVQKMFWALVYGFPSPYHILLICQGLFKDRAYSFHDLTANAGLLIITASLHPYKTNGVPAVHLVMSEDLKPALK